MAQGGWQHHDLRCQTRVLIAFRSALTHMISAMAFPWESLIAAAAGVIGGIGGAGVTGYLANKREEAAADRVEDAAEEARRRDAYASLLIASRAALRNVRQLRLAYSADTPDVPEVTDVVAQSSALASEMNQAAALAELVGSDDVRQRARAVYEKAKTCAEFYQERSIGLAGLDKVLGTRGLRHRFDAEQAERLCDDLATSIDAFADTARDEVLGAPRKLRLLHRDLAGGLVMRSCRRRAGEIPKALAAVVSANIEPGPTPAQRMDPGQARRVVVLGWQSNSTVYAAEGHRSGGQRGFTPDELQRLADIFGLEPWQLMTRCANCEGRPPQGFTCELCGAGGPHKQVQPTVSPCHALKVGGRR